MSTPLRRALLAVLLALGALLTPASAHAQTAPQLTPIGRYETGIFGEGAAEIAAYDAASQRLFFVNANDVQVVALDVSDPANPVEAFVIDITEGAANSVAVHDGLVAVAVESAIKTDPGHVYFYETDGDLLGSVEVGALPDMATFTPDGQTLLVANEGEPSDDYAVDPEGSVSVVDLSGGAASATVATVSFSDFNDEETALVAAGVRIFGPGATVAQDLEPEYIAVSPDGATAYVTLQENNALAVVNVATAAVTDVVPLGYKDHSVDGSGLDASNDDDAINIQAWPVRGLYMPDAIATFEADGQTYLVTANEGDAREYIYEDDQENEIEALAEEIDLEDVTLDPTVFPDAANMQLEENLGSLTITSTMGDTDGDGDYDELYAFGTRSFSIWAPDGTLVYDSGEAFERITAARYPADFNSTDDENDSFDDRSDNKGPEPEGVVMGTVGGRTYAFVGLERIGGVMVFDVTDPSDATFVQYVNTRDFLGDAEMGTAGDLAPEGLVFVDAADSPTGRAMLVVSYEVSGSVAFFDFGAPQPLELTILHNNDGESQLLNLGGDLADFGGVARFASLVDTLRAEALTGDDGTPRGVVMLSSGDNFLAGPEFNASLELDEGTPFYDTRALGVIGYDAFAIGNHDFDFGPDVLARFIGGFESDVPFLSANLDFSEEDALDDLVDAGRIAPSTIIKEAGALIGVVGATTPQLPYISSPRDVVIETDVAGAVQAEIDRLEAEGVNKIILISHLQSIQEDSTLIRQLSGLDVAIAGGGDELLAGDGDLLVPGDEAERYGSYPLYFEDVTGAGVPVVTTKGSYGYVGRLTVTFDAEGEITSVDPGSGPVRVADVSYADGVPPNPTIQQEVVAPVVAALEARADNVIAESEVALDGRRSQVRTRETNQGNLIADAMLWQAEQLHENFGAPDPEIALQNGGGIRNDNVVAAGDVSELVTFDMLPFGNFVAVVEDVSPAELKAVLENAVSRVEQVDGRFAQIAGFIFTYDADAQPRTYDMDGNVTAEGERIRYVALDDGTVLIENGAPVDEAPAVDIATADFLARGGDQYPLTKQAFTTLGVTYQEALENYLITGLSGTVSEDDYPAGGEGRIVHLDAVTVADARALPVGAGVTVEGIATRAMGRYIRVQDETAGITLFTFDAGEWPVEGEVSDGDSLRVTGELDEYAGLLEVIPDTIIVLEESAGVPAPEMVTAAEILADGEAYESELIRIGGLEFVGVAADSSFEASTNYRVASAAGDTLTLRVERTTDSELGGLPIPVGPFTFTGTLGEYYGTYQLMPVRPSDVAGPMTVAEARAEELGSVVSTAGVVTRAAGSLFRFQAGGVGLAAYDYEADWPVDGAVEPGDSVLVRGELTEYRGLLEVEPDTVIVLDDDAGMPKPVSVTVADLLADGEAYESLLIEISGLEVETEDATWQASATYTVTGPDDESIAFRVQSEADAPIVGSAIPEGSFTFTGVLGQFDETYQLIPVEATDVEEDTPDAVEDEALPEHFALKGNYPNPFNPSTTVRYDLPQAAEVTLALFDLLGREVRRVEVGEQAPGFGRTYQLDAGDLASGIYIYRLTAQSGDETHAATGRMVLVK